MFGLVFLSNFDYRLFRRFKWFIYIGIVGLLFAVKFVGLSAGGAKRWIVIAGFNFQPSEFAKVGLILFFASLLADLKEKEKIKHFFWGLVFPLIFLIPIAITVYVFQNHLSAILIIGIVTMVQIFMSGTSLLNFFPILK